MKTHRNIRILQKICMCQLWVGVVLSLYSMPEVHSSCSFVFRSVPADKKVSQEILSFSQMHRVRDSEMWGDGVYSFSYRSDLYPEYEVPPRTIYIWFPPEYHQHPEKRYPVLYMHDGQQIWDDPHCTMHGGWNINLTAEKLIRERKIEQLIIVGISHMGKYRNDEYMPPLWSFKKIYPYAHLIEQEIKPLIDRSFRTKPDRNNTAIAGSSLGALVSYWMTMASPEIFRKAGLMSPPFQFVHEAELTFDLVIRDQKQDPLLKDLTFYIDHDGWECSLFSDAWFLTFLMNDSLNDKGYNTIYRPFFLPVAIEPHTEKNWRERVHVMLEELFPKKP